MHSPRRSVSAVEPLRRNKVGSQPGRSPPTMGSFIALYGIENSRKLIAEALARG